MQTLDQIKPRTEEEVFIKNTCMKLLHNCEDDFQALERALAELTANHLLDRYKYRPFTMQEPERLTVYSHLSESEKRRVNEKNPKWVEEDKDVREYLNAKFRYASRNYSNYEYLKECFKALESDDVLQNKVKLVLQTHEVENRPVARVDWSN